MGTTRIKGITIELNGDATGLDKALKGIDKQLKQTESALKDVNRLLKLDPSNTELLRQKQELLRGAISETKERLDALKTASEQAAKTAGDYDAWKKAYTLIQEEIGKTGDKVKQLKEKMAELEKAGKIDTSEYQALGEELKNTESHLKELKQKAKDVSEEFGNPISHEQYDALQREIIETEQQLKQLKDAALQSKEILVKIGEAAEKFGHGAENAGKKLMPVTAGIAAVGTTAGTFAVQFEDAMAKLSTIADTTTVPIDSLKTQIMELSDETGVAADVLADDVYNAISAGQDTADAVSFVANSTRLARAGFAETSASLDILTTIMNAYQMEAGRVTDVSDMLIQTQNLGKTTVAELASAMGKVIPTAKAQNVELEDLCGAYAVMTANGIATAETTTYMSSMLNELGKQGSTAAKAFAEGTGHIKEGGLTMAEAMEQGWELTDVLSILDEQAAESGTSIANMFSSAEAGKAAAVLWDNASALNDAVAQMGESAGATDIACEKLETTSFKAGVALNQIKNTAVELGETILEMVMPTIEKIMESIKAFREWFSLLDNDQKEMIVKIAAVVAAIGPLLVIIGKLSLGVSAVAKAVPIISSVLGSISAPVVAVIAVVGTLVAAFVHLWETNEEFRDNIIGIWDRIKSIFSGFVDGIQERLSELGISFEDITGALSAVWDGFCNLLAPVFEGAFGAVATVLETVTGIITGLLDVFIGLFTGNWQQAWDGLGEIFQSAWDGITGLVDGAFSILTGMADVVCGWFGTTWEETWAGVQETAVSVWTAITEFFAGIPEWWNDIWTSVAQLFSDAWNAILENPVVSTIANTIMDLFTNVMETLAGIWDGIRTAASGAWELIKNVILGPVLLLIDLLTGDFEKLKEDAQSIWNNIKDAAGRIWEGIKQLVGSLVKGLVENARLLFEGFCNTVSTIFTAIKDTIWNIVSNIVEYAVNGFVSMVDGIWNVVSTIGELIVEGFRSAIEFITSLPEQAVQWGMDFINGLKEGIMDTVNGIFEAVAEVAEGIRSFLHFSRPDRGPLREYEKWMPDFMKGMADGIVKNTDLIRDAVRGVAEIMVLDLQPVVEYGTRKQESSTVQTSGKNMNGQIQEIHQEINVNQPCKSPVEMGREMKRIARGIVFAGE